MGLKNYREQLDNLKKCDTRINELVAFSKKLNALSVTMQSVWESNKDRARIFKSFDALISDINTAIDWFYQFRRRATVYLNKLNTLEGIVHGGYVPAKEMHAASFIGGTSESRKTRIQISVADFDGFYTQLKKMAGDLESIKKKTTTINRNVDSMVKKQFVNGEITLTRIISYLNMLQEHTMKVADAVKGVGEVYKRRETNLKAFATQVLFQGQSSGEVQSSIAKGYDAYKGKVVSGDWPEAKKYYMYDFNNPNLYLKQNHESESCNLTANAMLLRRKAYIDQNPNWENINKDAIRSTATTNGLVVWRNYNYDGYNVKCHSFPVSGKAQTAIDLLEAHPEGIVIWGSNVVGIGPHAILLTDYDSTTGTFYCAEPIDNGYGTGRIPLSESSFKGNIEQATDYWMIN